MSKNPWHIHWCPLCQRVYANPEHVDAHYEQLPEAFAASARVTEEQLAVARRYLSDRGSQLL